MLSRVRLVVLLAGACQLWDYTAAVPAAGAEHRGGSRRSGSSGSGRSSSSSSGGSSSSSGGGSSSSATASSSSSRAVSARAEHHQQRVAVRQSIAPTSWDIIGPFPASAREQGADALSAFGGILDLPRGGDAKYPSELASEWAGREAGKVGWSVATPSSDDGVTVEIDFGDMRWDFMEAPFGSSVRRATGWAVGDFDTQIEPGTYAVVCSGVSWFYLDGNRINGDVYRTGWRGVQPVTLDAGQHTLHVPFTTSGSTGSFACSVTLYESDSSEQPLAPVLRSGEGGRPFLFADLIGAAATGSVIASSAASIVVRKRAVLFYFWFAQQKLSFTKHYALHFTETGSGHAQFKLNLEASVLCRLRTAACRR
jgi:hypothetical protein